MQGDLGLQENIEKHEDVTAVYNFEAAYDKCLPNAILLRMRNKMVYGKCTEVGDKLISTDMIHIATEVCNSDRQLSIMKNLSASMTAATAIQKPSVSDLHVEKSRHSKKELATEGYPGQSKCKSS